MGCGAGFIGPTTIAFTQALNPRPATGWGRETATAVGWAVNSVSAPTRTISLTSGSGSGAGGSVLGCRRTFGTKVAYRSARPRSAVNLASGRCPPLAAVWPRLLRTDGGDRAGGGLGRSGGGLGRTNGEPIALGGGRGGGVGVCLGIGSDGSGRSGVGLHFRIGGERRDHGGANCKRHHASCEPEDGHLTTHPAAPVASETLSGVLGVSRGGAPKGSRPRAGFPGIFRPKCRTRRKWRAKAPPSGTQKRPEPARRRGVMVASPQNHSQLR